MTSLILMFFSAADFECIVEPIAVETHGKHKRRKVTTVRKAAHVPCAVAYKVSSKFSEYDMPVQWIYGRECVSEFVEVMKEIHKMANPILSPKLPCIPCAPLRGNLWRRRRPATSVGSGCSGEKIWTTVTKRERYG